MTDTGLPGKRPLLLLIAGAKGAIASTLAIATRGAGSGTSGMSTGLIPLEEVSIRPFPISAASPPEKR